MRQTKYLEKMDCFLKIRLTPQMLEEISAAATSRGMTVSDYVRQRALGHPIPETNPELVDELRKIRGQANKHAGLFKHLYNVNHDYSKETAAALVEAQKLYATAQRALDIITKKSDEEK